MENELALGILSILQDRFDNTPSAKAGHLAEISEEALLAALAIKRLQPSPDDLFKEFLRLAKEGKILKDDSDGGVPNYKMPGGNNHHYRYRMPPNGTTARTHPIAEYWITRNGNSEFFYDGNQVRIRNKKAEYVDIFDVVFSLVPAGGEISYKDVIKQCGVRHLAVDKKAIQRALTGKYANFFRYITDIPWQLPYGVAVFNAKTDGTGLIFNNKRQ